MIPWRLDLNRMEEDFFLRLAAPVAVTSARVSLEGARMLAAELREAVGAPARAWPSPCWPQPRLSVWPAFADAGAGRRCCCWGRTTPPPPTGCGRVGDDAGVAARRFWSLAPGELGPALVFAVSFWAADWTPWRALEKVRAEWSGLRFDVRSTYEKT